MNPLEAILQALFGSQAQGREFNAFPGLGGRGSTETDALVDERDVRTAQPSPGNSAAPSAPTPPAPSPNPSLHATPQQDQIAPALSAPPPAPAENPSFRGTGSEEQIAQAMLANQTPPVPQQAQRAQHVPPMPAANPNFHPQAVQPTGPQQPAQQVDLPSQMGMSPLSNLRKLLEMISQNHAGAIARGTDQPLFPQ